MTARFGWRAVFIANIPVILLALLMIRLSGLKSEQPKSSQAADRPRFDITGSVLLGAGLTLLVITTQASGALAWWAGLTGVALLAAFVVWERRVAHPVLDLQLYTRPTFAAGNAVIALQNLAMYALLFQLPIFFEQVRGVEAGLTGRTIIGMMIAMVVCAPIGGRLSERLGAKVTVFVGSLVCLSGIYFVRTFESLSVPSDALAALILLGIGLGLTSAPSQAAAMNSVKRNEAGMAGGAISMARYIGGIIGVATLGYLIEADSGIASHSAAVAVYAAALGIATLVALVLPGKQQRTSAQN
jgi:predicted MFS family arabinose efflux permease